MTDSTRDRVVEVYRRRAARYDRTANLYYLLGFREWAYRRKAVQALHLRPGDTVVEIGCGTGLNFPLLETAVGPDGTIVGVDTTDAMLERARRRAERAGWSNVTLVHGDALEFAFPDRLDAALSTFALSLVPECDQVVAHAAAALGLRGRLAVLDLKLPDAPMPHWLLRTLLPIVRPFAVTEEVVARRPWETIRTAMQGRLAELTWDQYYLGIAFLAAGRRRGTEG